MRKFNLAKDGMKVALTPIYQNANAGEFMINRKKKSEKIVKPRIKKTKKSAFKLIK